jgi:prevent-host-death family protein
MSRTLPISKVKTHLPALVVGVEEREEEIIVTRKGRPVAIIINIEEYERLRETLDILGDADLMTSIRKGRGYFQAGGKGVTPERVFGGPQRRGRKR